MSENKLTNIGYIRELMESNGIAFRKEFGQNFLINPAIPEKIASYISGNVLEIGPGVGCLTRELSARCDKVVSVEIDSGLIPVLNLTLSDCTNVKVINSDIMQLDLFELAKNNFGSGKISVCANLPYNITTPIIMKLLESRLFSCIVVMVQKEAGQRFCAPPGDPLYGAVSASTAYYASCERLINVGSGNFMPRPKVDSTVIRFNIYDTPPVSVTNEKMLFRVIRGAFAQRRKTLYNSLSSEFSEIGKSLIAEAIKDCGLEENIRGEKLSLAEYASLSDKLCTFINN